MFNCLLQIEKAALERIVEALDQNTPARAVQLSEDEQVLVKGLQLLTMKPMIYAANVSEGDLADQGASNRHVKALRDKACQEGCEVIIVSAQVRRLEQLHRLIFQLTETCSGVDEVVHTCAKKAGVQICNTGGADRNIRHLACRWRRSCAI